MNNAVSGYTANGKAAKQRLADELREALEQSNENREPVKQNPKTDQHDKPSGKTPD